MRNCLKVVILTLLCTTIVSIAQVLLKLGSKSFSISINQLFNYYLWGGAGLYIIGMFLFIWAFRLGELSVVYPLMASGFIVVTILSVYFFEELITLQKWAGIFLIIGGVVFIGRGGKNEL